jgi:ArsR family transcriptional regulator, arsenate/arsenite/antimonite-responsive transcriptional repressor
MRFILKRTLDILKAISDRNRLRSVAALMTYDELCAFQIIELLQIKGATVSRHLGQLVNAGILKSRKEGRWVYYRLNKSNDVIQPIISWINKELVNDEDLAHDRSTLEKILACDPVDICRKQRGEACCPRIKNDEYPWIKN